MKAKKSKGDGVFNKKNGFVNQKGSLKDVGATNNKYMSHSAKGNKNTGNSDSLDISVSNPEIFSGGHKKLSGSLLGELMNSSQGEMSNVMGENKMQPKIEQDNTMKPMRPSKRLK